MSEAALYLQVITPFLLRCWLRESHIQADFMQAMKEVFQSELCNLSLTVVEMIIRVL